MSSFGQSFYSHLEELRVRLLWSLAAFLLCGAVVWQFLDPLIRYIVRPVGRIVFTSPEEAFGARVSLAVLGGFLLSLPVTLFHLWKFVSAGLTAKEQKYVKIFGPLSLVFFVLGSVFGYCVVLPNALQFLLSFSSPWMVPMITVDKYISYVGSVTLASGIAFEMPIIIGFLSKIGIATPEFLRQKRPFAVILILVVAAVLTPPDIISQLILFVPLWILYELGIVFARIARRPGSVLLESPPHVPN